MTKKNEDIIYVKDILHALYSSRIWILILTVIGLLAGLAMSIVSYSLSEMNKGYRITSSIAVTSTTEDGLFSTHSDTPNSTDIRLAEEMVDSVIYVIRGDKTLKAAIGELNLMGITASDIRNNLTLKQYKETQIIEMTLNWDVAEEGIQILDAINLVAPQILIDSLKIGGVTVVDDPKSASYSTATVNVKLWFVIAAAGMALGMLIAVFRMLFFTAVYNPRIFEDKFKLKVIGKIPFSRSYFSQANLLKALEDDTDPTVRESFLALAHALRHRVGEEKPVCIFVTSALSNEGKTSVLANLAVQLAEIECRVLMVDLDVHNPSLAGQFFSEPDYDHSINAVYRQEVSAAGAIVHVSTRLDLLQGYLDNVPLPLNDTLFDIVKNVASPYDYVLIDTSPVGLSAETMNVHKVADTALFVARQDTTLLRDVNEALTRLNQAGIAAAGAVINAADAKTGTRFRIRRAK